MRELSNSMANDTALWSAFKAGSKVAFEEIYRREIQGLIVYGKKICYDQDTVQDAIQDLFIELWNSKSRLSETDNIRFYLLRSLRNKLSKKLPSPTEIDFIEAEPSIEFQILSNETEEERTKYLKEALSKLTKRQQEAINLRYYHELSNEEVASIMGLNYQSACKLIYSGLKFLKENSSLFLLIIGVL